MAHLHELSLNKTQIADAGLLHLVGLTNLRRFVLGSNALTHQGLVHLKGLTQLQRLSLDNTQVQDGGLIHLQPLMHLQNLTLTGTPFSAAGLGHPKTDDAFTRAQFTGYQGFRVSRWKIAGSAAGLRDLQVTLMSAGKLPGWNRRTP